MSQSADAASLSRIERVSVKDLALDRLKRYIFSGSIAPGQRLPSERELAERLGIGRPSVREALKVLEAVGLVESRIGEGTFIVQQSGASIGRTLGMSLARWGGTIIEICDARRIIEVECARIAAQSAEPADLEELARILERLEQTAGSTSDSSDAYLAADMEFHRCIARATHNDIVAHIVNNLVTLLEEAIHEGHAELLPLFEEGLSTHRLLYTTIAQHDAEAAAQAMRQHLQFSTELWRALISLGGQVPPETK